MGCLKFCCKSACTCCFALIAVIAAITTVLIYVPGAETAYLKFAYEQVAPKTGLKVVQLLNIPSIFAHANHGFRQAIAEGIVESALAIDGFKPPGFVPVLGAGGFFLARVSFEAARAVNYDPHLKRRPDVFVFGNSSQIYADYPGYFPEPHSPLGYDTDDPMRLKMRDMWQSAAPAFKRNPPSIPDFKLPEKVTKKDFADAVMNYNEIFGPMKDKDLVPRVVKQITGFSLFRHAFEVDLKAEELDKFLEYHKAVAPVAGPVGHSIEGGKHCGELLDFLTQKVLDGKLGPQFVEEAQKRGLDVKLKLKTLILATTFAGLGPPGTANFILHTLLQIRSNPKLYVPMYKKEPEAFIVEVSRLFEAGGFGMSSVPAPKTMTHTFRGGLSVTEKEGEPSFVVFNIAANRDPAIFGGPAKDPAYASKFDPSRENLRRTISFVSELQDIEKCPDMIGCDSAPRFCFGTWLSQRIVRQAVDFLIDEFPTGVKDEF